MVQVVMGSTDVIRVHSGRRQGGRDRCRTLSSAPCLTFIAARAEQRHARGRRDNARCRLIINLEARSTVVVSKTYNINYPGGRFYIPMQGVRFFFFSYTRYKSYYVGIIRLFQFFLPLCDRFQFQIKRGKKKVFLRVF